MPEHFDLKHDDPFKESAATFTWGYEDYIQGKFRPGAANTHGDKDLQALVRDPYAFGKELENNFKVFDRNGDGKISREEAGDASKNPQLTARQRLMAEVVANSAESTGWVEPYEIKDYVAANDPDYVKARTDLGSKLRSNKEALLKSALENFSAFSDPSSPDGGREISNLSLDRNGLNPEQREIARSLFNADLSAEYLKASNIYKPSKPDSNPDIEWETSSNTNSDAIMVDIPTDSKHSGWSLTPEELKKDIAIEHAIRTGTDDQLKQIARERAGEDFWDATKAARDVVMNSYGLGLTYAMGEEGLAAIDYYGNVDRYYNEMKNAPDRKAK